MCEAAVPFSLPPSLAASTEVMLIPSGLGAGAGVCQDGAAHAEQTPEAFVCSCETVLLCGTAMNKRHLFKGHRGER